VKQIAPSILSCDFARLGEEVRAVEAAGADWIHIDVMDGHFVPAITIGPDVVKAVHSVTSLTRDVHLMIENPDQYLGDFIEAGADRITVHQEACVHLHRSVNKIKELGAKAGVAINPATPVSSLESILEEVSLVLIMTVNPGFGGQNFIEACLPKISEVKELIVKKGYEVLVEVDGGIKPENAARVAEAGADVFVAGSAIFKSDDYAQTISAFRQQIS
jgi:ribulose-phosphate 3-epimerase